MWRLAHKNRIVVEKYSKKPLDLSQFYKIDKKIGKIEEDQENRDKLSMIEKLDNIDAQVTGLLLHAKKRYRKLRIREVDFSSEVSKVAKIQYLQRIVLKVAQGSSQHKRKLAQILYKLNIEVEDLANMWIIKSNVSRSRIEYLNI